MLAISADTHLWQVLFPIPSTVAIHSQHIPHSEDVLEDFTTRLAKTSMNFLFVLFFVSVKNWASKLDPWTSKARGMHTSFGIFSCCRRSTSPGDFDSLTSFSVYATVLSTPEINFKKLKLLAEWPTIREKNIKLRYW